MPYKHRLIEYTMSIDSLEEAYVKIANDRWGEIRTYHSDIYYITHLVNYQFNTQYSPQEINEMLYEEGLLKWSEYVPQRFVARMSRINFKHVAETRPDYTQ